MVDRKSCLGSFQIVFEHRVVGRQLTHERHGLCTRNWREGRKNEEKKKEGGKGGRRRKKKKEKEEEEEEEENGVLTGGNSVVGSSEQLSLSVKLRV